MNIAKLQDAYCRRHQIHLPPLKKRFEYHTLTLFFKMKHQMVPQYLSSLVPAPTSESSRYSFRKLSYPVPLVSKTSTLNSFLPRAIILWNSLPAAFQDIKTLAHFKFQLKSFLKLINLPFFPIFGLPFSPFIIFFSFFSLFSFPIPIPIFCVILLLFFFQERSLDKYTCPTFLQSWLNICI